MRNLEHECSEKLLDKAHDHSTSTVKEMYELYGHDERSNFLHTLLNQCALGLDVTDATKRTSLCINDASSVSKY